MGARHSGARVVLAQGIPIGRQQAASMLPDNLHIIPANAPHDDCRLADFLCGCSECRSNLQQLGSRKLDAEPGSFRTKGEKRGAVFVLWRGKADLEISFVQNNSMTINAGCMGDGSKAGVDGCAGGHDEADLLLIPDASPDEDAGGVDFNTGFGAFGQQANGHSESSPLGVDSSTIAEAGGATSALGGGRE